MVRLSFIDRPLEKTLIKLKSHKVKQQNDKVTRFSGMLTLWSVQNIYKRCFGIVLKCILKFHVASSIEVVFN